MQRQYIFRSRALDGHRKLVLLHTLDMRLMESIGTCCDTRMFPTSAETSKVKVKFQSGSKYKEHGASFRGNDRV